MKAIPLSFAPREWAGAFGDLGISVPVLLALSASGALDLSRALFLFGAYYICAGLYFRIPLPVQPLKAATALVIAQGLGAAALKACSLWIAAIFIVLSCTGLSEKLNRVFTRTIVRGIQCGVGLLLFRAAYKLLFSTQQASALPLSSGFPGLADMWTALWVLVLPQLPLTLGNSVAATCEVSRGYFGDGAARVDPTRVSLSIGVSNLVSAVFGGLPVCHGSGGVTAHHKFGARTAGATIIMGTVFILLSLALGSAGSAAALGAIPAWLLAAMLAYTGLLHTKLLFDPLASLPVAAAMGLVGVVTNNLSYALALGLAAEAVRKLARSSAAKAGAAA
ncbi:MAG: putative sulfate/molybdate transporter [Elusimicrobiota bacterium]|nr:putative sulfate/molybdate transporter [Elusimicrobiota bacterium]